MKALLYNLQDNTVLKNTLAMMNVECIDVNYTEYNKPLGTLLGLDNNNINNNTIDFKDEMIIMYEFNNVQLDALLSLFKINNIKIPLKAIVTETNINWSSLQIRNELIKEHMYMQKKRSS